MDRVGWFLRRLEGPAALQAHVTTGKAARAFGTTRAPYEPHPAGLAVHYALGAAPGALVAPLRHRINGLSTERGLLRGPGLFLVNDDEPSVTRSSSSGAPQLASQPMLTRTLERAVSRSRCNGTGAGRHYWLRGTSPVWRR